MSAVIGRALGQGWLSAGPASLTLDRKWANLVNIISLPHICQVQRRQSNKTNNEGRNKTCVSINVALSPLDCGCNWSSTLCSAAHANSMSYVE